MDSSCSMGCLFIFISEFWGKIWLFVYRSGEQQGKWNWFQMCELNGTKRISHGKYVWITVNLIGRQFLLILASSDYVWWLLAMYIIIKIAYAISAISYQLIAYIHTNHCGAQYSLTVYIQFIEDTNHVWSCYRWAVNHHTHIKWYLLSGDKTRQLSIVPIRFTVTKTLFDSWINERGYNWWWKIKLTVNKICIENENISNRSTTP